MFLNQLFSCSQELLIAVEAEKRLRSRSSYSSAFPHSRIPFERLNAEHVSDASKISKCYGSSPLFCQ